MASSDTPELGRLVVLHHAILAELLNPGTDDASLNEIRREADALVMLVAHRSRSAAEYHESVRGKAALADAAQVIQALKEGDVRRLDPNEPGAAFVELVNYVWDREQLNGPILPGMEPQRKVVRRFYAHGLRFMGPDLDSIPPIVYPDPS